MVEPENREQLHKPIREVNVGKEFRVFSLEHSSVILLNMDTFKIPLGIFKREERYHTGTVILPFLYPEQQYDMSYDNISGGILLRARQPQILLSIESHQRDLDKLGLIKKDPSYFYERYKFDQEVFDILKTLRLQLAFPKAVFEAKPTQKLLEYGQLSLQEFHPAEAGFLFADNTSLPGYRLSDPWLSLPDNPQKLQQIKAKFVLVDEQPEAQEAK